MVYATWDFLPTKILFQHDSNRMLNKYAIVFYETFTMFHYVNKFFQVNSVTCTKFKIERFCFLSLKLKFSNFQKYLKFTKEKTNFNLEPPSVCCFH